MYQDFSQVSKQNQSVNKPFDNVRIQNFKGDGPWEINGKIVDNVDVWIEEAHGIASKFGMHGVTCDTIRPDGEGITTTVRFTFKSHRDYRNFQLAVFGDEQGEHQHKFEFSTTEEARNFLFQLARFSESQGYCGGSTIEDGGKSIAIKTDRTSSLFAIISAFEDGLLTKSPQHAQPKTPSQG